MTPRPHALLAALLAALAVPACDDSPTIETAEDISYVQGRVAGRELGTEGFLAPSTCVERDDPRLALLAPRCISRFDVFAGPVEEREGDEVRCVYRASWSFIPGGCSNAGRPLSRDGALVVAPLRRQAWDDR